MFHKWLPALLACCALPASAATSYYIGAAGETAFNTTLSGSGFTISSLVNFSGTSSGTVIPNVGGTGVNVQGKVGGNPATLTVTGNSVEMWTTGGSFADRIEYILPANTYALGIHVMSGFLSGTACFGPIATGVCSAQQQASLNVPIFFGVISDAPLGSHAVWSWATLKLVAQDLKIATQTPLQTSEAPEPSTMALLGSALVVLPWLGRRLRGK